MMFGRQHNIQNIKITSRKVRAGLTLTEVVIASVLLVTAIIPILKGLTGAYLGSTIIEYKSKSLILAQAKLDEIKARSIYHYNDTFSQTNLSLGNSYLCNVSDESAGSSLKKITVSVGFDLDGNNELQTDEIEVTLATYLARRWTN